MKGHGGRQDMEAGPSGGLAGHNASSGSQGLAGPVRLASATFPRQRQLWPEQRRVTAFVGERPALLEPLNLQPPLLRKPDGAGTIPNQSFVLTK